MKRYSIVGTIVVRIAFRVEFHCLEVFFLLPVGLSGTTFLRPQLRLLQGSPCHSLTLGEVWGWIWAPNWPKVGGAAPGFEPRTAGPPA